MAYQMKKLLFIPIAAALLGAGGVGYAMSRPEEPAPVVQHAEVVEIVPEEIPTPETEVKVEAPTPAPVVEEVAEPTPEENRAKIRTLIEDEATRRGLLPYSQWRCFDAQVNMELGYDDYDEVADLPFLDTYFHGFINHKGKRAWPRFEPSCAITYYVVPGT